jgi:hypothetical protein
MVRLNQYNAALSHRLLRDTGNTRNRSGQRLQSSWIDKLTTLGASAVCALGYAPQGGLNLIDFGNLSLLDYFERV